jgi:hypothetical protein
VLDDDKTFIVEHVLDHEVVVQNKKQVLNLNIKWQGYPDDEWNSMNTTLQDNGIVQKYLSDYGLEKFGRKPKRTSTSVLSQPVTAVKRVKFSLDMNTEHSDDTMMDIEETQMDETQGNEDEDEDEDEDDTQDVEDERMDHDY